MSKSYDAFSQVDKLVSKPVMGSDGAASWQEFKNQDKAKQAFYSNRQSVAPKAPLKKSDRLGTGLTSWQAELEHEAQMRKESGHAGVGEGYTTFKQKDGREEAALRKKNKQIEARIRPDDKEYYIPAKTFEGWKFDYVFTSRPPSYGTGYFWDGMDSIKQLKGELPPSSGGTSGSTTKQQDGSEDKVSRGVSGSGDVEKPKKKKRKKGAPAGPTIIDDPNNPMEQVAAAIRRKQAERLNGSSSHPSLPSGWEVANDPSSGKTYYFCRATGERRWEAPGATDKPTTTSAAASTTLTSSAPSDLPDGWVSAVDTTSGKTYYYKADGSGERTWEKPTSTTETTKATTKSGDTISLPPGWKSAVDAGSGKVYYYNDAGETRWEIPSS